jgi:hypothetical protein
VVLGQQLVVVGQPDILEIDECFLGHGAYFEMVFESVYKNEV